MGKPAPARTPREDGSSTRWFFLAFFGAPVLTAVAAVPQLSDTGLAGLPWIVAALVLYGVVLAVTVGMNVPLNNAPCGERAAGPDR
ncbi:MAG: anthrone oxygenase family protein [Pseudonocardia sp.]